MHDDEKKGEHANDAENAFEDRASVVLDHFFSPSSPFFVTEREDDNFAWTGENRQVRKTTGSNLTI